MSFIPNCRAEYHSSLDLLQNVDQLHFILLQSGTIITLWVQEKLTSQEKTLSQPLDNIFSRSRYRRGPVIATPLVAGDKKVAIQGGVAIPQ